MALFLVNDFKSLLSDVILGADFHNNIPRRGLKPKKFEFPRLIYHLKEINILPDLNNEKDNIILAINQSSLKADEKDFLKLYLTSILAYTDLRQFDTEQMKKQCSEFLSTYPKSEHYEYVEKVLFIRLETSKIGIGVSISSGYGILNGNISKYLKNQVPIGFDIDFGYNKFLIKTELSPSFTRHLKEFFEYKDYIWSTDSMSFMIHGNLNLSYVVLDNSKCRISPYLGIGTHGVNLTDDIDNMLFKPGLNVGVDLDWKFANTNFYGNFYETFDAVKDKTYWYLRFKLGYSQFNNADSRFIGSMLYSKIEIGFYSNPAKRIKNK